MPEPYSSLRSCAACSAHLLSYRPSEAERDAPIYCKTCELGLLDAEEQLAEPYPRLALWTDRHDREYILNRRDGGRIWVRPLGRPDLDWTETTVAQIRPRFRYTKLNAARRRPMSALGARVLVMGPED